MRKIVGVVVGLLIVAAGFFGVTGAVLVSVKSSASDGGVPADVDISMPSGISLRYSDSDSEDARVTSVVFTPGVDNYIRHHDQFGAFYNTTGYLMFSLTSAVSDCVDEIEVKVKRLGIEDVDDDIEIVVDDFFDESDRQVFYWNYYSAEYRAVGVYQISVMVWYCEPEHEHGPECVVPHEGHDDCEDGDDCDIEYDIICPHWRHCECGDDCESCDGDCEECYCNYEPEVSEPLEFVFLSVCKSFEPSFGANFSVGSRVYAENFSLASGTSFEVRARVLDERVYWNDALATYTTGCEVLRVSDDGKYMILYAPKPGLYTLTFTVTFQFVGVDELGKAVGITRAENVSLEMEFFEPSKQIGILEVLIGVVVLGALGGAAYFVTKLSRGVEQR